MNMTELLLALQQAAMNLGKKAKACKLLGFIAKRLGKGFNEGAAAGGTVEFFVMYKHRV